MNSLLGGLLAQLNPSHVGKHRLIFLCMSHHGVRRETLVAEKGSGMERHVTACRRGTFCLRSRVLPAVLPASPHWVLPAASSCLLSCWTVGKLSLQPQGKQTRGETLRSGIHFLASQPPALVTGIGRMWRVTQTGPWVSCCKGRGTES